jgi:hypothetical protein
MKGDFSRISFDASGHFTQVLSQQGRPLLDADFNEASALLLHRLRCLTRDLFGAHSGPSDSGFALEVETKRDGAHLFLSAGRYYVDGLPCENDERVDYVVQPDWQVPARDELRRWLRQPDKDAVFLVYLDVWERWISALDDPRLADAALGGVDTCGRSKLVWQAKAVRWDFEAWEKPQGDLACAVTALQGKPRGRMAARLAPTTEHGHPDARYTGSENALYRIEVHAPGPAGKATFKWSRDNGSTVARWRGSTEGADGYQVNIDKVNAFAVGDWVELTHDALELGGQPGTLACVLDRGEGWMRVAVSPTRQADVDWNPQWSNPKVRRWHRQVPDADLVSGAVKIVAMRNSVTWIDIENGLQVAFEPAKEYRNGDYWLIPARVPSQSIDWPPTASADVFAPPMGIEHSIAPLGLIGYRRAAVRVLRDCRELKMA